MKLVSVVVPVYNVEEYLAETIESVISQQYEKWELLLVDDGSTDKSSEIAKAYADKDPRIKYFHKTNGGQASARNIGIQQSSGDLITFLDSDDLWLPERLAVQINEYEQHKADFMYGLGYLYYPERTNSLEAYDWVTGQFTGEEFFKILYTSSSVNTNTVMVRKELFDKVGLFDENDALRGTEDWDLWLRIAAVSKSVFGSTSRNVYYRIHPGGIHLQNARMFTGKRIILAKYKDSDLVPNWIKRRQYRYVYRELMNFLLDEKKQDDIPAVFEEYKSLDKGFGIFCQRIAFKIFSTKRFVWWSKNVIYRIAYRLEAISYKFKR